MSDPRPPSTLSALSNPSRLRALDQAALMESRGDAEFDRLTDLAAVCVGAPVCLVSLVGENCQVFPGATGLCEPLMQERRTPISHSFCQHVVARGTPMVVADARTHPLFAGNPAIQDLRVVAYLGFPITTTEGVVLGAFCVIDHEPRPWSGEEIARIRDFTAIAADMLENRMIRSRTQNVIDVVIHDLKSPLAGVSMAASLLQERADDLPDNVRPLLDALTESSAKGIALIRSLSSLDDLPESAGGSFNCLSEVVSSQAHGFRRLAQDKDISLELVLAENLPRVATERWVIERIIENLVGNALKFSPFESTVRISTSHEKLWVKLEISDQGPGFSEEDRKRMFQRYAKLSAHPTGGEASTGVGLSIVKRLVDQSSGRIRLRSGPGDGAVFEVLLPMVD